MDDFVNGFLSTSAGFIDSVLVNFTNFILQYFPDADGTILSNIRGWGDLLSGYDLTFNYFYFVDTLVVTAFMDASLVMILAWALLALIRALFMFIDSLIEAIPVIE